MDDNQPIIKAEILYSVNCPHCLKVNSKVQWWGRFMNSLNWVTCNCNHCNKEYYISFEHWESRKSYAGYKGHYSEGYTGDVHESKPICEDMVPKITLSLDELKEKYKDY